MSKSGPSIPNATLLNRIARLTHPVFGIKRDIIEHAQPWKGGNDANDKLIPVSVGEIREVYATLVAAASAIEGDSAAKGDADA